MAAVHQLLQQPYVWGGGGGWEGGREERGRGQACGCSCGTVPLIPSSSPGNTGFRDVFSNLVGSVFIFLDPTEVRKITSDPVPDLDLPHAPAAVRCSPGPMASEMSGKPSLRRSVRGQGLGGGRSGKPSLRAVGS